MGVPFLLIMAKTHLPLSFPSPEVPLLEVFHVGGVNCPIMSLPVGTPSCLDKAVVEGEVVSYRIPPAWASRPGTDKIKCF